MKKFFTRAFGVVWIVMIVLLSFDIAKNFSKSGMSIMFLLASLAFAYYHFSGQFDPSATKKG